MGPKHKDTNQWEWNGRSTLGYTDLIDMFKKCMKNWYQLDM